MGYYETQRADEASERADAQARFAVYILVGLLFVAFVLALPAGGVP
jgi:hypothetical protein